MDDRIKDLSNYRLEKANNDLQSAKLLFEKELFAQSINRSYYAIFHAVRALLAFNKFDSKTHSGIISYFDKNYIKTGIIEKEYSKIIHSAEKIRTDCDYDDFFIVTRDDALKQINNAEKFIENIFNTIRKIQEY